MAKQPNAETEPQIERLTVADLKPHPKNPKTHPEEQVEGLGRASKRFGFLSALVVHENKDGSRTILAGEGRWLMARREGIAEVPGFVVRGWSARQQLEFMLSDNQWAMMGPIDDAKLRPIFGELADLKTDFSLLGYAPADVASMLKVAAATDRDLEATPEPKAKPIVRPGDLWEMGEHRLVCGDATDKRPWRQLMNGQRAALVFTDPPYGVSYQAASGEFAVIEGDAKRRDDLYRMLWQALGCMAESVQPGAAFYIWHASATRGDFMDAMDQVGIVERQYLMWAKPSISLGHADYQWAHEPCFYAARAGESPKFYGTRSESTVWRVALASATETAMVMGPGLVVLDGKGGTIYLQPKVPKAKKVREVRLTAERPSLAVADDAGASDVWEVSRDRDYKHPTQKPVELARRAIDNSSKPGEIVVDGFSGSGTTLIAAEATGRRAFVMDVDPVYAQVAIERWQELTGKQAVHDGKTFDQVAKARAKGRTKERTDAQSNPRKPIRGQKQKPDHRGMAAVAK